MAPEFATARLRLRRWREDDFPAFASMNADPTVMEFFPRPLNRVESDALATRIRLQLEESAFGLWAVELPRECPFMGFVGLAEPKFEAHFTPCVEIGWRLAHRYWGKGYAFEAAQRAIEYAFGDLELPELVSFTPAANVRSQALMRKLGFTSLVSESFEHPLLPANHPHKDHVLYRLKAPIQVKSRPSGE